ncbi:phosphoenolpyruvate carboxylase [Haloarcula taiwanensis]|uniref:phosphoenolpyruvate carboxylase n=1 Tax=Haloarcula taiwanensis TaxID=1932004 RepID=A0A2H4ZXE6_9EURY|nr:MULTISPECIES: phosphoenolpyruvate carboxylase [Haloarcula]AUG47132.1 phosphoenolpyruvate carboxylase [Haloarcula taiwanensis]RLM33376.1 phosphoenolpyruvate carboxylase [Haloarcula sp. Atlit-120R]RLM42223.1 phosphoenolpyruvate carboxylase [Haloarcula sp. Atlit-47R]RLM95582.1 phosphoenolpyruvate carboxylase [Haloarcula sp. Atlit-7R]
MTLHAREINQDVRELGALLGEVLEAQTSTEAFETVETIRNSCIDYRRGDAETRDEVHRALNRLNPETQDIVARAFTTYFELINLAEERERVREIREGSQEGVLADSVEEAVRDLAERGADPEEFEQVLEDVLIQPTFTAHPTEARRKTVKAKLRSVARDIERLDERRLTEREQNRIERDLDAEVTSLWQTPQVRDRRPEVTDEALNVQWYLENVLFDVIDEVYDELEHTLEDVYDEDIDIDTLYEFRSWAGSDRDGNPFVTTEVTEETLERQRDTVLPLYRNKLKELSGVLSQDASNIATDALFNERLDRHKSRLPGIAAEAEERYPDEPYRQKLRLMRESVIRVSDVRQGGYENEEELLTDLRVIADSLRENDAEVIAEAHVDPLIRKVETFGFTLASLDLRDHRKMHTDAIAEAVDRQGIDYAAMDEDERVEFLTEAILQDNPVIDMEDTEGLSEDATRVLDRFRATADWQNEFGIDAIDTYAISWCEEPSHALEVLFLADQVDIVDLPGYCGFDVVPLLESEYALSGARRIMGTLFENEAYSQALEARDNIQEIMLGYSDSNKENGFLAANWSLYNNQKRLADITDDYDVEMRLFHGRGGSISRGGGPMNDAMLALPNETVTGQIKFTEQGEAIAEKYANHDIAERNLEQMLNAQIRARKNAIEEPVEEIPDEWEDAMETAADAARDEYQDLLETDGFVEFFEQATPITVIENLNMGSRPASRSEDRSVEDLRAIPWVFSWTQARCIIPGWYSISTGLDAYLENGGDMETLQEMYENWPFFRTKLDNASLALARTDLGIAEEYADLADPELRERIYPRIVEEYEDTVEKVLEITGQDGLLSRDWLKENLERRNPYVDPLNLLQVRLLKQSHRTETERRTLRLTVQGIAAGMKNTG